MVGTSSYRDGNFTMGIYDLLKAPLESGYHFWLDTGVNERVGRPLFDEAR